MDTPRHTYSTSESFDVIRKTTLFLGLGNFFIASVQLVVALFSRSHALFADAMHTYADLIIDVLTYFAGFYGHRPPDEDHPYGHRRIETVTGIFLALFLSTLGAWIIVDVLYLNVHEKTIFTQYVMIASAISVLCNEALYRYASYQAKCISSQLLLASAAHQRSDALSSILVLISATLGYFGYYSVTLDSVVTVLIGLFILKMGLNIVYKGVEELIDTGLTEKEKNRINTVMCKVEGVENIHHLRSRKMAGSIFIDVHVITSPYISVSEGHYVGEILRGVLKNEFPKIVDITVHIDAEDDEYMHGKSVNDLPSRKIISHAIKNTLSQIPNIDIDIKNYTIHYLDNKVYLEIPIVSLDISKEEKKSFANKILVLLREIHPNIASVCLIDKTLAVIK